jgi:SPX domain protein involved in polyphosphate accumulation
MQKGGCVMEPEWISLNEFMRRNHIGYETALKLINSGKVEYQKLKGQYKIKISKNENTNETMEKLIRENEELKTFIRTLQNISNQIKV